MENLIEKLKVIPNNFTVNMLDDETIKEVVAWVVNYAEEGFATDGEIEQAANEVMGERVADILDLMNEE